MPTSPRNAKSHWTLPEGKVTQERIEQLRVFCIDGSPATFEMVSCLLIRAFEESSLINDKALFKVQGASPQVHMRRTAISVPEVPGTHP